MNNEQALNVLHNENCDIIKGSKNIKIIKETEVVESYIGLWIDNNHYNFCSICNPKRPCIASIKEHLINCQYELESIINTEDDITSQVKAIIKEADLAKANYVKSMPSLPKKVTKTVLDKYRNEAEEEGGKVWLETYKKRVKESNIAFEQAEQSRKIIERVKCLNEEISKTASYIKDKDYLGLF